MTAQEASYTSAFLCRGVNAEEAAVLPAPALWIGRSLNVRTSV